MTGKEFRAGGMPSSISLTDGLHAVVSLGRLPTFSDLQLLQTPDRHRNVLCMMNLEGLGSGTVQEYL